MCFASEKSTVIIQGAGATFPYPLYEHWFKAFGDSTGTRILYQAVGSGDGIRQLIARKVDFCASDALMSDQELAQAGGAVVHIPTCIGGVVLTYNLPGNPAIRLTPQLIQDIFLGTITVWSDKRIKKENPGLSLPSLGITVVHRSEGSGTTHIFTSYLSAAAPEWKRNVGAGKTVRWPRGIGVQGNAGIVENVKRIPGSIGYVEYGIARDNKLPVAAVRNRSGAYVTPTLESLSAAAERTGGDTPYMIVNTESATGYPISAFTFIIVYRELAYGGRSRENAAALVAMLEWMISSGQARMAPPHYAPLPESVRMATLDMIHRITFKGVSCAQQY